MLTQEQKLTLKAAIVADPAFAAFVASPSPDGAFAVAAAFNQPASPDFVVWRTTVTRSEILQNGFDWTRLDNLSVGKARVWTDIFVEGRINPSKPNVRAGIEAVWVGTAQDLAVRAAVYVHCKRSATRVEKLFATGTGTTETPGTMTYEGSVNYLDVMDSITAN